MFSSKSEVDQYVMTSLQKIKSEKERNLRSLHAAQLYNKVHDYDSARKYVLMYLSEKEDSTVGHKLLGDAYIGLGQKTKAIAAYKKSLELQSSQPPLLLKICELLCDREVEFDAGTAKYFLDRAAVLFPHAPAVFTLKEKLLIADSSVTQDDFERLILSELKARPTDVNVRVKLLKLHLELKKVDLAYTHVIDVESKQLHHNSLEWYQCSSKIFKAYYEMYPKKCDWEFFMMWMSAIDRLCLLSLDETNGEHCDVVTNTEAIYMLDQTIYLSTQKVAKAPEIHTEFIRHITGQLALHLVVLLMKRAKKETSLWKETKKSIAPLLLFAACGTPNTDANWCLSIKENQRKLLNNWAHQGRCRYVQSGYLLNALAKECQTVKMFMDKVNHFSVTDWRKRIFEKTFLSIDDLSPSTSHFVTSSSYAAIPQKIPLADNLKQSLYVQSFEMNYIGSLHHLVWLGLQSLQNSRSVLTCKISSTFHTTLFKNMQFSITNLHNTGVETLNQLDIDAFLYATVFCTGAVLEDQQVNGYFTPDRPALLPADITPTLCTSEQAQWWSSACSISKAGGRSLGNNIKMSDLRHILQRGIEVVRGDGLPLPLMVCLARTFGIRGSEADSIEESDGCENRSVDLWRIAVPILERLASNMNTNKFTSKTKLFEYAVKDLLHNEITSLLDEGRFFIASYSMRKEQFEKALDIFKLLRSPQANYNMATIYLKLAEEQVNGLRGEEITSELRCKHVVLATKAREALQSARDMIKGDHNHPLQHKIKAKVIEVEDLLSRIERENGVERDGAITDESISLDSGDSPSIEKVTPLHHLKNISRNPAAASTPRRALDRHNNSDMTELINQQQQNSNTLKLQQIMEQSKLILDRMDSIIFEQRSQRSLIEDLTAKFNHMETEVKTVLADIKKEVKRPDLYNMLDDDDDDYPAEEILQYNAYPPAVSHQTPSRVVVYQNQRTPVPEAQFAGPQYFSPRVDQMYQNSVNFFNAQGTLPFVDGQTVPDYLRGLNHPKFPGQMPSTLAAAMPPIGHMGLNQMAPMIPNPAAAAAAAAAAAHGLLPQPKFSTSAGMTHGLSEHAFSRGPTNVVITTSDTLPTGTPPAQPALSVTIPPQHRLGDPSAAHQFQISFANSQSASQNKPPTPKATVTEVVESDDDTPGFHCVAPLPTKINPITLEENETVLFEKRAKLFRFADQTWKERGIGIIKILKSKTGNKYRILMRREKVHDVCANHSITPEMKLDHLQDKSWFWVAQDFSEDVLKTEKFSIRFKTSDETAEFKRIFDVAVATLKSQSIPNNSFESANTSGQSSFGITPTTPKNKNSSILAPGRLFSPNVSESGVQSPLNSTLFGTPQSSVSLFGKTPQSSPMFGTLDASNAGKSPFGSDPSKVAVSSAGGAFSSAPSVITAEKTTLGGFTFSTTPKLTVASEPKQEQTVVESKKMESPFAKFSFPTLTDGKSSFGFSSAGDQQKSSEPNKSLLGLDQAKTSASSSGGLFSPATQFPDFGTLAKANQESTLTKLLADTKTPSSNIFAGAGAPVFGNKSTLSFQAGTKLTNSPSGAVSSPQAQENDEDFVPTADFAPVIPLPELVDVKGGEENEEVLFAERAKLFRYDKSIKEWRDRGVGVMKILRNNEDGIVRLLMRREQVHKVCCNHRLSKDIEITKSKTNEKAYCWNATDFSDDTNGTFQQFTIRFKLAEQGLNFEETFKTAQANSAKSPTKSVDQKKTDDKPPLSSLVTKSAGSWDCSDCFVNNQSSSTACVACGLTKPGLDPSPKKDQKQKSMFTFGIPAVSSSVTPPAQNDLSNINQASNVSSSLQVTSASTKPPLSSLVNKAAGSWECSTCYVSNDSKDIKCVSCATFQPGAKPSVTAPSSGFSFGIPPSSDASKKAEAATFSFGMPSSNVSDRSKPLFGMPAETKKSEEENQLPLSASFTQPEGSWECKECYSRNNACALRCLACEAARPGVTVLSTPSLSSSSAFSFGNVSSSLPSQTTNITSEVTITPVTDSSKKEPETSAFTFGVTGSIKTFSLSGGDSADKSTKQIFSFGGSDSFVGKPTFQFSMPPANFDPKSPTKNDAASDNDVSDREDHNDSIHFEPVIPLPDIVAVQTGEENETVLYSHRAKLYRYDSAAKEWKERGIGDVKILLHNDTGNKRLLMRREPVMKLSLNHNLTDEIEMKPMDDKSWIWVASDFSSGEACLEKLAIRFKTKEFAQAFFEAVEKAKQKTDPASPGLPARSSTSEADDDVLYVQTITASDELVKKARSLQLPDNYYLYLDRPPCPGCIGCERDGEDEQILAAGDSLKANLAFKSPPKGEPSKLFAGSKTAEGSAQEVAANSKPNDQPLSLSKPIFGTTSSTFSFDKAANFSFAQALTNTPEKTSQNTSQPFFSNINSLLSQEKTTPTVNIFGNVAASVPPPSTQPSQQASVFSNEMPTFGTIASVGAIGSMAGNDSSITPTSQPSSMATPQPPAQQSSIFSKEIPSFGSIASSSPSFGASAFPSTDASTFGALAASSPNDPPSFLTAKNDSFKWEGAGSSLFGHLATKPSAQAGTQKESNPEGGISQADEDDDPEKEVQGIQFEPVVPLPDKIELSTGEEDEEVLFNERAKLFRYSKETKEWKERGVGAMKVLRHKTNNSYRLLMRREQVHKIVCNQRITTDLVLKDMSNSETSTTWGAMNLAQEYAEPQLEMLALKLKNKDLLEQFKSVVNDVIANLNNSSQ